MTRILAVTNQKGGVGKTTTSVNLAAAFARAGQRVLLVDLDPQGNATMGSGVDKRTADRTVYHVLLGLSDVAAARTRSQSGGYDLLPANRELAGAEIELVGLDNREGRLRDALAVVASEYDFIIIDCPPSLSLLTINGLVAAQAVLIPMQCEYYALEGLSSLLGTIDKVRKLLSPALELEGLLLTMFDSRNRLSHEIAGEVRRHFPEKIFRSVIPRSVRMSESPSHGLSVLEYEAKSAGAKEYRALAAEIIEREAGTEQK